jgi:tRNA(Arg) A34 adenosine deaminase TadA
MEKTEIKDPIAKNAHSEIHNLETICRELREMRTRITTILVAIDAIELDRVIFIQERQKICKDCERK